MTAIRRACVRLGVAATISLLVSVMALMFLFETRSIATWVVASAVLAALSFATAAVASRFEP